MVNSERWTEDDGRRRLAVDGVVCGNWEDSTLPSVDAAFFETIVLVPAIKR